MRHQIPLSLSPSPFSPLPSYLLPPTPAVRTQQRWLFASQEEYFAMLASWFQTFNFQNCEKIHFYKPSCLQFCYGGPSWLIHPQKPMKSCSTLLVMREMQIKNMVRYHYPPTTRWILKINNTKCWQGYRAAGYLTHCWYEYKILQPHKKTVW